MPRRGEIWLADLGDRRHNDIGKIRPVLIVQNDRINRMIDEALYRDIVIVPLSTRLRRNDFVLPIPARDALERESVILCHAIKMIDAARLLRERGPLTSLSRKEMHEVERRLLLLLAIDPNTFANETKRVFR
ncbi:type II toxin-antitoxin system PemK/MazF family toxin [Nitratifractor sp.]